MPPAKTNVEGKLWELPPLILHPFNERVPPSTLLDNSKAALMLSGLIPGDGTAPEDLTRRLMIGRYSEIRMLYFLGKDIFRWIDQCQEWTTRSPELRDAELHPQSFAALLTQDPPPSVREKLVRWGVMDFMAIFCRAIGVNCLFSEPPQFDHLADEFLRNYHRYLDSLYRCFLESQTYRSIEPQTVRFELYASGEYSRLLESEWGTSEN